MEYGAVNHWAFAGRIGRQVFWPFVITVIAVVAILASSGNPSLFHTSEPDVVILEDVTPGSAPAPGPQTAVTADIGTACVITGDGVSTVC